MPVIGLGWAVLACIATGAICVQLGRCLATRAHRRRATATVSQLQGRLTAMEAAVNGFRATEPPSAGPRAAA